MAISEPAGSGRGAFTSLIAGRVAALVDGACASHRRALLLLVVVSLIAFLPGFFSIAPIDRDEARFAQATKQMLETGNFVDIRFKEQARHKKPVGIYWLQAASVATGEAFMGPSARTSIFLYRLPSLFAAIGSVLLTYWIALQVATRRGALIAGLMMASCVLLGVEARLAKTDAVLLFTVLATMGALARVYLGGEEVRRRAASGFGLAALFWTALAAGILIKGPMAPLFVGLAVLALVIIERSGRFLLALRPLPGLAWCLLLCLPWFIAIYYVTGGAFYQHAVGVDMLGKVAEGAEGHSGLPGTYLLLAFGTFWPAIVLVVMAVPFAWRNRRDRGVRFLLAWLVPAWLVFEITATKLPHYVLPLYPALAILAALAVERGALIGVSRRLAAVRVLWPVLAGLLILAMVGGAVWLGFAPLAAAVAAVLLAAAFLLLLRAAKGFAAEGAERAFLTAATGALLLYAGVYQFLMPHMKGVWISERLAAIARDSGCAAGDIVTVPYQEPSLAFLVGTDIQFTDPRAAADLLKQGGCKRAFLGERMVPLFEARAAELGLKFRVTDVVDGFAYNGGRLVHITVVAPQEARP